MGKDGGAVGGGGGLSGGEGGGGEGGGAEGGGLGGGDDGGGSEGGGLGGGEGGGGEGGGGEGGASGGASWRMVTSVLIHAELQYVRHVCSPCGGEDESLDLKYATREENRPMLHFPSPSRSLTAVVLGAVGPKIQPVIPLLPPQSGSQYSQYLGSFAL